MKAFWGYVTAGIGCAVLMTLLLPASGWGAAAASDLLNVVGANTASAATTTLVTPPGTFYTVNAGPGNHYDPHVDGNLVAYSNIDLTVYTIHYYNLTTRQDATIPPPQGNTEKDFLSDVNAGRIAYTFVDTSHSAIALYDTTTNPASQSSEINPIPGSAREAAQIGGDNIAWQDFGYFNNGASDIVVYNLPSQTLTRLTSSGRMEEVPAISPDGNVLAWMDCASFTSCAIDDAVYSNGSWAANALTTTADGYCNHPDTNGTIVAYDCTRTVNGVTSDNVYFQPVGGGTEQEINWGGQGEDPSVAGNFISFAGETPGATNHQLYVAELTPGTAPTWDGTLYQITNGTDDVQLNDTTVGADGSVTVAWQVQDIAVYAFTFAPESAQQQISSLAGTITSFGLPHGLTTSLLAKLNAAQADFQAGNTALVCGDLQALINEANAQSGKGLTVDPVTNVDQAATIISDSTAIRLSLSC
jgi:hypothetical protein